MKSKITKAKRVTKAGLWFGFVSFACLLTASQPTAAQFTSTSRIIDMTRTMNRDLWDEQRRLEQITNQNSRAGRSSSTTGNGAVPSYRTAPPIRQFPITATDFLSTPRRLLPDQMADSTSNLTREQREGVRRLFHQFLTDFEKDARRNNVANSLAFVVGVSYAVVGANLSEAEGEELVRDFNNRLASIQQFNAMSAQQKQLLYESLVITGGSIGFLHAEGIKENNLAMQLQAREMAKAMLKHFRGIDVK